jgi:hypothetical protein
VLNAAVKHIGDRLDATVRVPGKALQVISGIIGMEIVKEEERVEEREPP